MGREAHKFADYCPFCGEKGTLEMYDGRLECSNNKCETKAFTIYGGVKDIERE